MNELENKVLQFIKKDRLCPQGSRVLVACSGGADSLALLEILYRLSSPLEISIGAIAIDHRQSTQFERAIALVESRCRRLGLPFLLRRLEDTVPGESETELRKKRYQIFEKTARDEGWQLVATAHHQDDQVETVLLRLLRGTSVTGLAAMSPRRGIFIRPLLCASRLEIISYLKNRRLRWWSDPANRDQRFPRNRVRHRLLPFLEREFNPAVRLAILRLANAAARERELLDQLVENTPVEQTPNRCSVHLVHVCQMHPALQAHLLRRLAAQVHPEEAGLEEERVEEVLERLASGEKSFSVTLGGLRQCTARHGKLTVTYSSPQSGRFSYLLDRPGELLIEETGQRIVFSVEKKKKKLPPADNSQVYFDADEIDFPLQVRSLQPGDSLQPWGQCGTHKVSRLLMEEKIPRDERWQVPIVVWKEKIIWVAGVRRSRHAPVTERTTRVLVGRFEN